MAEVKERGVVVVTRNGRGDWWKFDSFEAADQHPLVQYGDVICKAAEFIERKWTRYEFPDLLDCLVDPVERANILREVKAVGWGNWTVVLDRYRFRLWTLMLDKCNEPPTDLKVLFDLIVTDRILSLKESKKMAKESTAAATEETAKPTEAAAGEKTKPTPPVREPKYKGDAIVTMLADKDGNAYGKDNNPKRDGSKSHERFALYVNGMTVDQAIAAGITRADIDNDVAKKFISVK